MTKQYGVLYQASYGAHLEDICLDSLSAAIEQAYQCADDDSYRPLGIFSIDMTTGDIAQIYNRTELLAAIDRWIYQQEAEQRAGHAEYLSDLRMKQNVGRP